MVLAVVTLLRNRVLRAILAAIVQGLEAICAWVD
jgi:hypothetical protein